ncbi:MAG: hypothetical protein GQ574_24365 [Crocinitomix sp.]|nr:hypothetical protein [Crocinitomix sp.]
MHKICFILSVFIASIAVAQPQEYILSSGSQGGNYDKAGKLIVDLLNAQLTKSYIANVNSSGSIENLNNLEQDFSDFAIVQRNLLLETIYSKSDGVKNIEIIAPLFQEKLLIYHKKGKENRNTIAALKEYISTGEYTSIGFTSMDGYAYQLFNKIAQLLHIQLDELNIETGNYDQLVSRFNANELDLLVTFSLEIEALEKNPQASAYHFSQQEAALITTRISNTNQFQLGKDAYTIGSHTFLIGLSPELERIEANDGIGLSSILFKEIQNDTSFVGKKIKETLNLFKKGEDHNYLAGMPVSEALGQEINYESDTIFESSSFLIFIIITVLLFFFFRKVIKQKLRFRFYWLRFNHIFFGILLLVVLYVASIEVMIWAENDLYEQLKLKSQILNMSRSDLHLWVIVSTMVSDSNGVFPLSTIGKLMLSISFYTTWIGGLCIIGAEYFKKQSFKKRLKGMKQITFKDHVVISGWNMSSEKFVTNFLEAVNEYSKESQKLVCVVPDSEKVIQENEAINLLHKNRKIEIVAGDVREESILKLANIHLAKTVVLFAENSEDSADEKTLLRALSISRFCRKRAVKNRGTEKRTIDLDTHEVNKYIDSIYIIAELNNEKYKPDLLSSDVNEIICSSNYSRSIITQSILNRGVSKVLDEVLTYDSRNEFYSLSLCDKENKLLVGKNFDELLILLRKVQIQLIGIRVIYHDTDNREIIDREEIARLLEDDGLESDMIINPVLDIEMERKVDDDDTLIVFCKSGKELSQRMKKLTQLFSA